MKQPHWDRIQEIYHVAVAMPRSERSAFIANASNNDPLLLREVNALLDADDSSGFLESPVFEFGFKSLSGSDHADVSSADNLVGTTIDGRYLIHRKLGHGGMGQVYFALDLKLNGRAVVIKILSQALLQDPYARQKFKQEVEALSRVHHVGVVDVLDAAELADGRPYIVMQYVDGETLHSQIPSEGMNLERAASMLKQIGAALEHVHEKGIFHRDLKPENIMVKRGTDSVVVVDFGIAKVKDSVVAPSTVNGISVGTVLYMSPEQLSGERITAASDVYSMAVIAYEMVTGRRPFNPATASQLPDMQRAGVSVKPIGLRPSLSPKAQDIILRGLSFKPKARYKRASEFGNDLECALNNEKEAPGNGWPVLLGKNRLAVIGALIILTSVAALFAFYKYRSGTGDTGPTHLFTYWLTVQKMRDGKDYQDPFRSNGEEIFERADKFRLAVSSPDSGYLYVINEGPPEPNDTSFSMIYPSQATNNGSATLGANQAVQSDWIIFRGPAGAENFWIVWSASPVSQLESAKSEAFKHPNGGLTDHTLVTVKEYLKVKQSEIKVRTTRYKASQTVFVRGTGDMLVTLAQFKHR